MKEAEQPSNQVRELTRDYRHQFHGLWAPSGLCRIRTFELPLAIPVIVATELPQNDNASITNMAEYLAAEILEAHFPERVGAEPPLVWVEHYPERAYGRERIPEEFDLVRFERTTPIDVCIGGHWRRSLGAPSWCYLSSQDVERLIGGSVDVSDD